MRHLFFTVAFTLVVPGLLFAEGDEVTALKARISALERETSELRGQISQLKFLYQAQNGVEREVQIENQTVAKLIIAPKGWGSASPRDVAAVCHSCAATIVQAIRPKQGQEPTVLVIRSKHGPMVLSRRGPNDEFILLLNSGDRLWAQVAYQFSHEFGHVLCGDLSLKKPQHWFEEAFCESLSLWTMEKMGESWKTNAPYKGWQPYATNLASYAQNVRNRVAAPEDIHKWFAKHRTDLTGNAYDREKNLILAKHLADQAHNRTTFYKAFYYLRRSDNKSPTNSLDWLLADWASTCPEELRFAPQFVTELLGVVPSNK